MSQDVIRKRSEMVQLSHAAVSEILRLRARRKAQNLSFRLRVRPSGCLGLLYSMDFDEMPNADDQVFDCGEVKVLIDAESFPLINGLVLDYSEDLMGGGFRFHNPNATQSCGCGNSFSIAD